MFKVIANEFGEYTVEKIQGHIDDQDLSWTPLSDRTIELKSGDSRIYIQTGLLRDSFKVLKVELAGTDTKVYVGVDPSVTTEDGTSVSDILMYMEYGTDKQVPRPLVQPTFEELKPLLKKECMEQLRDLLRGN